ncbi:MAG: hypothetical protein MUC48_18615 [Leptolyngbya sp. Prado105]|nr:hypothetical protein [Leptolyngbya sp. Prado105]
MRLQKDKPIRRLWLHLLLVALAGVLSGLSACTQSIVPSATSTTPATTRPEQPTLIFPVQRRSGTCPTSIGVWEILLPLEGGADHIVVADIRPAKITASTARSLTYAAPLAANYASCVGQAIRPQAAAYRFEMREGQIFFRINPQSQVSATIVSKQLASGRPYVFWRAESP